MHKAWLVSGASLLILGGCASHTNANPQLGFWNSLKAQCGKAFAGRMVSNDAADADMVGAPLVMHVSRCSANEIRIPFHVGPKDAGGKWDRSRTWVITRTANGLRLKHDHRHEDGSEDKVTQYGGDTQNIGSAIAQHFHVDAESIAMFMRENLARSITNIWTVEMSGRGSTAPRLAYVLRRTGQHARHFRVEFDLSRTVATPPNAWGQN